MKIVRLIYLIFLMTIELPYKNILVSIPSMDLKIKMATTNMVTLEKLTAAVKEESFVMFQIQTLSSTTHLSTNRKRS